MDKDFSFALTSEVALQQLTDFYNNYKVVRAIKFVSITAELISALSCNPNNSAGSFCGRPAI